MVVTGPEAPLDTWITDLIALHVAWSMGAFYHARLRTFRTMSLVTTVDNQYRHLISEFGWCVPHLALVSTVLVLATDSLAYWMFRFDLTVRAKLLTFMATFKLRLTDLFADMSFVSL